MKKINQKYEIINLNHEAINLYKTPYGESIYLLKIGRNTRDVLIVNKTAVNLTLTFTTLKIDKNNNLIRYNNNLIILYAKKPFISYKDFITKKLFDLWTLQNLQEKYINFQGVLF